ncbi:Dam family site-specific DNA-(adenine-N6)-methyltransferase [Gemella sanguinis]|uniref:Dam family site-specific DNA-(adenine-N6)-methyltransferase n=1 Tax=Gemella sanguinis TaxID=84135 RepID=UPI00352C45EC
MIKTTKQIEKDYGITRQTIYNWIKEGLLIPPKKDFRNWLVWDEEDESRLKKIINDKEKINNTEKSKSNEATLKISNRRYLGSKQKLLSFIEEVVDNNTENINTVADVFCGTGVVADLFRKKGKKVIVNDILKSNVISYNTWFGNEDIDYEKIKKIIYKLNALEPIKENYVSINFGDKYFSMYNARKIGIIREKIESYTELNTREKSFLLTSLIYAMDKVANTVGHYDAYRKKLDSFDRIQLKIPEMNKNKGNKIYCENANKLVKKIKADLTYIDTPYNSRQYGDAYHLLENIVEWKKPKVSGVAQKMLDRSKTKSKYSTKKAPEEFDDLIQNINSRYILVSYNNMAKKGNGRSNAKISNEEILKSLEKRGKVKIFETPFRVFTTGKTNITDHKEILYLCYVKENDNSVIDKEYTKSPINYTGGKYKLLNQLLPLFPRKINTFYDVFSGGGSVGINVEAQSIVLNDIEKKIQELFKYIKYADVKDMISEIEKIIKKYNLSNTLENGYEFYNVNSSIGLKKVNERQYLELRNDYNNKIIQEDKNIIFYILIVYAFNNQIRFNKKGDYNMPPGKRDFNSKMKEKLINFSKLIKKKKIEFLSYDFRKVLDNVDNKEDFVYLDPPYLISTASYNENGGWTEKDEYDLLDKLDILNEKKIKFALSNVIIHKGKENSILKAWAQKYNIHYLNFNYNNSNYQSAANEHKTVEVLITNY